NNMKASGLRRLFDEKPVLLRLIAAITRQWIDNSRELALRLHTDQSILCRDLLSCKHMGCVVGVQSGLSDPHNHGHSVQILTFEDGAKVVYKPKDLRVDVAFERLITRLNLAGAPIELRTARTIAKEGYGWSEFVVHRACSDHGDFARFFYRAGAWLAI